MSNWTSVEGATWEWVKILFVVPDLKVTGNGSPIARKIRAELVDFGVGKSVRHFVCTTSQAQRNGWQIKRVAQCTSLIRCESTCNFSLTRRDSTQTLKSFYLWRQQQKTQSNWEKMACTQPLYWWEAYCSVTTTLGLNSLRRRGGECRKEDGFGCEARQKGRERGDQEGRKAIQESDGTTGIGFVLDFIICVGFCLWSSTSDILFWCPMTTRTGLVLLVSDLEIFGLPLS